MNHQSRNPYSDFQGSNMPEDGGHQDSEPLPAYSSHPYASGNETQISDNQSDVDAKFLADSSILEQEPLLTSRRPGEPGFATESALRRGLQVPSKSHLITSGFEYPSVLARCGVSEADWTRFTREITDSAALSGRQWTTAIGRGFGTLAIGGLLIGLLGAVPAVMVAQKVRERREKQNLAAAVTPGSTSSLPQKIELWNESYFKPRGIMIRIDLPYQDLADIDFMDISTSEAYRQHQGQSQGSPPHSPTSSLFFERQTTYDEGTARTKASRKGRIVIIPLEGKFPSGSSSPSTMSLQQQENDSESRSDHHEAQRPQPISSILYEQRTGKVDYYPFEPKP